ncbi:uncharacterized protein LOC124898822 [Capsicum annuum]|uniref:uncharacterized protein LOC124898822 n=1 Tax=Capsicum annuum TaxID=4072 RepID=UPI001FB1513E|nr:uncharacterized protein LOC124898822 [Capsicum annuum]
MAEFSDCVNALQLIDPPLFGGFYTWRRGESHNSASRIDRFLYSTEWEDSFTQVKQTLLPRLGSDHNPILFTCGDWAFKKSYFKFENWWLEIEGFKDKVKVWWNSFPGKGRPAYILANKLKLLKKELTQWSKNQRVNWKQKKEEILLQISSWETLQEHRALSDDELKETEDWRPEFKIHNATVISTEDQIWLKRNFDEEEILEVIRSCATDKAPGTDGFPINFYLTFWELIKGDIMVIMQYFHDHQVFEKSLNATYVALIPKKAGETELRDFRLISLISGVYKILAKALAERLKKVIAGLVKKHQMVFIKGRQIMDAALIASECVDTKTIGEVAGLICKLDIEKAFDHVNWDYLLNILKQMGFGDRWLKWISFCIKTIRFSILARKPSLSLFFILAMEGLGSMVRTSLQNNWVRGFKLNSQGMGDLDICHLLYADDTLIFCEAIEEQFEGKLEEKQFFPIKEVNNIQTLTGILGCGIGNLPTVYLGMPLGNKHKDVEIWDKIIEKTMKRLSQ